MSFTSLAEDMSRRMPKDLLLEKSYIRLPFFHHQSQSQVIEGYSFFPADESNQIKLHRPEATLFFNLFLR